MNRTEIKLNGESIPVLFGSWVMGQLIKAGYPLASLHEDMTSNPFVFFPKLVYLGAVNATPNKDLTAFNENDFFDWVDEVGGISSGDVTKVINTFTRSLGMDVGESKKKNPTTKSGK